MANASSHGTAASNETRPAATSSSPAPSPPPSRLDRGQRPPRRVADRRDVPPVGPGAGQCPGQQRDRGGRVRGHRRQAGGDQGGQRDERAAAAGGVQRPGGHADHQQGHQRPAHPEHPAARRARTMRDPTLSLSQCLRLARVRYDLVDLRLFVHVVAEGSITAGARRMHLSPALGQRPDARPGTPRRGGPAGPRAGGAYDPPRPARRWPGTPGTCSARPPGWRARWPATPRSPAAPLLLLAGSSAMHRLVPRALLSFLRAHSDIDVTAAESRTPRTLRVLADGSGGPRRGGRRRRARERAAHRAARRRLARRGRPGRRRARRAGPR